MLTGDARGILAARAYFTLDYLGHGDHASLLDGGTGEVDRGIERRLRRKKRTLRRAQFTPHVRPEILVSTAQMR